MDYDPKTRYKKKHVIPALIIPGPHKPKYIDSYTFRSFHHLSALQHENNGAGLPVWDAEKECVIPSKIGLIGGLADAVGLTELDGRVGHHGAQGCQIGCEMTGMHKPNSGHYYVVHLRTDKSRHTHTEMRHDTRDRERHTCPMFNTFDGKCRSLIQECVDSSPHNTILFRLILATMFPFRIVRK